MSRNPEPRGEFFLNDQLACYRPQTKFVKGMFLHMSACPRGDGIPACLAGLQAHTRGGEKLRSLAGGGFPGPQLGGLQAHTHGGLQAQTWGDPNMHWGRSPQQMATAVGGTHPTGMHSCLVFVFTFTFGIFSYKGKLTILAQRLYYWKQKIPATKCYLQWRLNRGPLILSLTFIFLS